MSFRVKTIALLILAAIISLSPLILIDNSEFTGADSLALDMIKEITPSYKPWFERIWHPPGSETESFLFAVQAALGAGFLGYYFGYKRGKKRSD
ncbi:MAG: energy-coupling factor ABC transporter substrate-binding protein [Bacillota bacterium]